MCFKSPPKSSPDWFRLKCELTSVSGAAAAFLTADWRATPDGPGVAVPDTVCVIAVTSLAIDVIRHRLEILDRRINVMFLSFPHRSDVVANLIILTGYIRTNISVSVRVKGRHWAVSLKATSV